MKNKLLKLLAGLDELCLAEQKIADRDISYGQRRYHQGLSVGFKYAGIKLKRLIDDLDESKNDQFYETDKNLQRRHKG